MAGKNERSKKRAMFVRRVQSIFAKVMDSDVGKSDALRYGQILRMDTDKGIDSVFHRLHLRPHIELNLLDLEKWDRTVPSSMSPC